jgi:hypothetical protein
MLTVVLLSVTIKLILLSFVMLTVVLTSHGISPYHLNIYVIDSNLKNVLFYYTQM